MSEEIEIARQWLDKADNDLLNADNNLSSSRIPYDTVCLHCQQAVEKMLKAFLVANRIAYPISHDLLLILESILIVEPQAEKLRDFLVLLNPYAVEIRYPDEYNMPSDKDAAEARNAAGKIRNWLKNTCPIIFSE